MDALGDFIAKRREVGETKVNKHPEKSIWLTCRTCRPERWVCTVCRKRKAFPELCPVRKIVSKRIGNTGEILFPAQTMETAEWNVTHGSQQLEVSELPKLKVKTIPGYLEEIRDLEQAKDLPFSDVLVFAEGYRVNSYEELVQLVAQDSYRDREFVEVVVLPFGIVDGG